MQRRQKANQTELLKDREYRHAFVESALDTLIAGQIRLNREKRGMTQKQLGNAADGMRQSVISNMEDPDYGSWSISSLRRLARAFDLALIVKFESFGKAINEYVEGVDEKLLLPPSFESDPMFEEFAAESTELSSISWQTRMMPQELERLKNRITTGSTGVNTSVPTLAEMGHA